MAVELFLQILKAESIFGKYPLCITTSDIVIDSDDVDADDMTIECYDFVDPYELAVAVVDNVESLPIVNVGGEELISDFYNSVVKVNQKYKNKDTFVSVMPMSCCANRRNVVEYSRRPQHATIAFVAGITASKLVNYKRIITPSDIIEDIKRELGLDIDYMKAWRAKESALKMLRGRPADGYKKMPTYVYMLNSIYPNSHIRMHKSPDNQFMYLFVALQPFIRGFGYYRPIVVVDDNHMRGPYQGTFVSASILDGAGHILPLAYGVVDSENNLSWMWFFQQFKCAFSERNNMCVVSDRHESIIKAVSVIYPCIPLFACIWHLWKNVCTNYRKSKDKLTGEFFAMAKAYKLDDFDELMCKVGKIDNRVKAYLENVGFEKWSRVHAPINRGRMVTSNIAECINSCLVEAREMSILDFFEQVRILFGVWNRKNRDRSSFLSKKSLGGRFQQILQLNEAKSSRMMIRESTNYIYDVYEEGRKYIIRLDNRTYNCGRFQLDEIPCEHAIVVLKSKHVKEMKSYYSDYYKKETLVKTYEMSLCPMPDKQDWHVPPEVFEDVLLPPKYKRPLGRPKKGRKKISEKFSSTSNHCGKCGYEGHNRRTCNYFLKKM
ncbi:uncharacterized protein LOC107865398 [Capsicum annuum]|uniref:uncharacterized protein LOC107865398 n=1 Tax=Capsicum annuum TaxID=4072 RepID=UPI001FB19D3C|nr:uncharacterized protein LOC107865398 [Capsicum annuum]